MKLSRSSHVPLGLRAALVVLCVCAPALAHAAPAEATDAFTAALAKGPIYAALAAFAGGLGTSLTPCVYPMIAITVSVFGAAQAKTRWQGASLSLAFVLGIIAVLTPLGVIAGLSGTIFGSVMQNHWLVLSMVALFLVLASGLFGAFEMALPAALTNKLAEIGGIGYKGAFLLGIACAFIAAPCTGPVLTGILAFIAKTRSSGLGAGAMAAFGSGLGLPFFVVGTFAVQLPKSGPWMVHVKSIFGIVLVAVALYYSATVFPVLASGARASALFFGLMAALVALGLLLGAVHREFAEPGVGVKIAKALGIIAVSAGLFLTVEAVLKPHEIVSWEHQLQVARDRATRESRPLLVDFGASWCVACKELDKVTFAAPDVASEMSRFVNAKVDATNDDDPKIEATLASYQVRGLPTVVVLDSHGKEAVRFNDFVPPEKFLPAIRAVE